MIKTICVMSGGCDSTTLLYKLIAERKEVKAISFNYGQRHSRELDQAKLTCQKLGVEHKVIDISFLKEICSNSALTGDIAVPHGHYEAENMKLTVVPNRNSIMANIAIGWAVNLDYDEIALGVHAGDFEVYPDCRPVFIEALSKLAELANFKAISVYAPYLNFTKADIVADGIRLGTLYEYSQTCYEGKEKPCMRCGSCSERTGAFMKNNVKDPLYTDEEWIEAIKIAKENGI